MILSDLIRNILSEKWPGIPWKMFSSETLWSIWWKYVVFICGILAVNKEDKHHIFLCFFYLFLFPSFSWTASKKIHRLFLHKFLSVFSSEFAYVWYLVSYELVFFPACDLKTFHNFSFLTNQSSFPLILWIRISIGSKNIVSKWIKMPLIEEEEKILKLFWNWEIKEWFFYHNFPKIIIN